MRNKNFIIMLVCIALITIGAVLLFFSLYAVYKVEIVPMSVEVTDRSSFNTDTDMLNFGKAQPGNSNSRTIIISHEYDAPLLIAFKREGDISPFMIMPEKFYLEPGLSKEVTITAKVPVDAPQGNYTGKLTVYFRRI